MMHNMAGSMQGKKRLTVSLDGDQHRALEAIARNNRASLGFIVRLALDRFIEQYEADSRQVRLNAGRAARTRRS